MTQPPKLLRTTVFRLSLLYVAVFGAAICMVIAYIYWNTRVMMSEQLEAAIKSELQAMAAQYQAGGLPQLVATVAERSVTPGNNLYLVADSRNERLAGNMKSVTPDVWDALGRVQFTYRRPAVEGFEARLAVANVFRLDGDYRLLVGRDIEDQRQFQEVVQSAVLWGLAAITLVGLGGGILIGRRLLARIDAVTDESRAIMAADMTGRLPVSGSGDELDRLSLNLNGMFDRIEQLMSGLREVSDNIAHDLKTPLNRLRNRAEAALREGGTEAAYRDALQDVIDEADELIRTFDALLKIARMEAGARSGVFQTFDLSETLRDTVELYEPLAEEHGLIIHAQPFPALHLHGERQLIAQAIANLFDNAIKYAAPANGQGRIAIEVRTLEQAAEIVVADNGPGIAQGDRQRALKRFGRLEASRSKPGSGLGLSLVAAVAHMHGGDVELQDNAPGLRVVMRLPYRTAGNPAAPKSASGESIIPSARAAAL